MQKALKPKKVKKNTAIPKRMLVLPSSIALPKNTDQYDYRPIKLGNTIIGPSKSAIRNGVIRTRKKLQPNTKG